MIYFFKPRGFLTCVQELTPHFNVNLSLLRHEMNFLHYNTLNIILINATKNVEVC